MPSDLDLAVQTVVRRCLAIQAGENVLVVGDEGTRDLAEALRAEAAAAGADAVLALMDARQENGSEPPPAIAAAFSATDVYIAPTTKSLSHTQARKAATEAGIRGATLPGITSDLLARVMTVDFDAMRARCHAIAELLSSADGAHITCPAGTDLRLDLSGRAGLVDDGDLTKRRGVRQPAVRRGLHLAAQRRGRRDGDRVRRRGRQRARGTGPRGRPPDPRRGRARRRAPRAP